MGWGEICSRRAWYHPTGHESSLKKRFESSDSLPGSLPAAAGIQWGVTDNRRQSIVQMLFPKHRLDSREGGSEARES